ncbi:uncharacterized protein [Cicer arietinum]|uniref:Cyclin-D-binding Myb-like transcription factor 1 n=1 Tax=Cicer arietinum TaxID=3827 RepID=A0A1S2Y784_CICAR|nr:cyclin-D-binding Myb-like transcription factor 1 [Cicer arietinum]
MKALSKKNKRTKDEEGETNGVDNVVDLPLAKSNDDLHLVKSNKSEDDEQGKKMKKKKKKLSEKRKHKEYNEFQSNACESDDQGKMKKKIRLCDEKKLKEGDDFRINDGEDGEEGKKIKKKKKKRSEESKHKEYNEIESNEGEDGKQGKKIKKKKRSEESRDKVCNEIKSNECEDDDQGNKMKKEKLIEGSKLNECNDFRSSEGNDGVQDKKKKKKKKLSEESIHKEHDKFKSNECGDDGHGKKKKKKKKKKSIEGEDDGDQGKTMKKKELNHNSKSMESNDFNSNDSDAKANDQGKKRKKKKVAESVTGETPKSSKGRPWKPKRVTFSDQVEFCCDGLLRGKRFTPEEDEKIKAAVNDYIDSHCLGENGLDMILHCGSHPEIRGCWKEIAEVLPERPVRSVYERGHVLLENGQRCRWTPDELEFIRKSQEIHGSDWRPIADALGKSRFQVKDAWRRLKFTNLKQGQWSQDEYQTLFDLVNLDLRTRATEPYRKSMHGMLRDNISWEAIGNKLSTRNSSFCCKKWYEQLTTPLVASGEWCDTDDYRLISTLYTLDACCRDDVEWDDLLEHRSGDVCRLRWDQMVQHIGEHAGKSFIEQVEVLAKRFCPDLLEAREAFDNKPVIC